MDPRPTRSEQPRTASAPPVCATGALESPHRPTPDAEYERRRMNPRCQAARTAALYGGRQAIADGCTDGARPFRCGPEAVDLPVVPAAAAGGRSFFQSLTPTLRKLRLRFVAECRRDARPSARQRAARCEEPSRRRCSLRSGMALSGAAPVYERPRAVRGRSAGWLHTAAARWKGGGPSGRPADRRRPRSWRLQAGVVRGAAG